MRKASTVHRIEHHGWDPEEECHRESLFGVGNGWLFLRATAPELCFADLATGRQNGPAYPGAYVAGRYNHAHRTVSGKKESIAALVNLPYPFALSFRPSESPTWFTLEEGRLHRYEQWLNMRTGRVYRRLIHEDTKGRLTRLCECRVARMGSPEEALLLWRLTPLNWSGDVVVCARLPTSSSNHKIERHAAYEGRHLDVEPLDAEDGMAVKARTHDGRHGFIVRTKMGVFMSDEREWTWQTRATDSPGTAAFLARSITLQARQGRPLRVKLQSRIQTGSPSAPQGTRPLAPNRQADARILGVEEDVTTWRALAGRDLIHAPGMPRLERHLRYGAFQLLQSVSRWTEQLDAGFPARGWQEGYFGHVFWDEVLAFPFLDLRMPALARGLLAYRHRRLAVARQAARRAGFAGAMYPWRSAETGEEETPAFQWIPPARRWLPDHTDLQHHIGSAVAFDVWHHHLAVGDLPWLRDVGAPMMVEIARFWTSRATWDPADARFHVRRVVGPDEYHTCYPGAQRPGLDDNAYTNLMTAWTLLRAAMLPQQLGPAGWATLRHALQVDDDEITRWQAIARQIHVPLLADGAIEQFAGFDRLLPPDAEPLPHRDPSVRVDWWLTAQGRSVDAYQVTKQADVLAALHLLSRQETAALLEGTGRVLPAGWYEATIRHYLSCISHESHLSRVSCAGALAEADRQTSWRYFDQALDVDLKEAKGQTDEGLHLGALAGLWDVLQRRYLGLAVRPEGLAVEPHPPSELDDVGMVVSVRGHRIELRLLGRDVKLRVLAGEADGIPVRMEDGSYKRLHAGDEWSFRCR